MARFASGVRYYTTGTAIQRVHFPEDDISCKNCDFCYQEHGLRFRCRLTKDILYNPVTEIGVNCPIVFDTPPEKEEP